MTTLIFLLKLMVLTDVVDASSRLGFFLTVDDIVTYIETDGIQLDSSAHRRLHPLRLFLQFLSLVT